MKFVITLLINAVLLFLLSPVIHAQSVIKWEETFVDTLAPPEGWRVINNDGSALDSESQPTTWTYLRSVQFVDANDNVIGTVNPQAGQSFWFSNFGHANDQGAIDEWLISPKIPNITAGDSLCFFAGAVGGTFNDSLRVFVSTTDSLLGSFTNQIAYFKVDGPLGNYTKYQFSLSDFAGSDIFVAVNYFIVDCGENGTHSDNVWLDHFIVTNLVTSVGESPQIVEGFELLQNYPNPFNPSTKITFTIPQQSEVTLQVYNLIGQVVAILIDGEVYQSGQHSMTFDAANLPNGIYYYKIEAEGFIDIKKMTLLK